MVVRENTFSSTAMPSFMQQQSFSRQISLNYAVIPEDVVQERVIVAVEAVDVSWLLMWWLFLSQYL